MPADLDESYHLSDESELYARQILDELPSTDLSILEGVLYRFHTQLRYDRQYASDWQTHVEFLRQSPGFYVIQDSALSGRSVAKPRGYAGDAAMIDSIYGLDNTSSQSESGKNVYEWELRSAACRAVRARRQYLARLIDTVPSDGRILSVACGHLREAELACGVRAGNSAEIVGVDQDAQSIAYLQASNYASVVPTLGSVKQILTQSLELGSFDLIYSAGLYDYLNSRVARALTERLMSMLRPNGKLYIANFTPELPDIAYMEAMMDWWLVYRTAEDCRLLAPVFAGSVSTSYMSVLGGMNAVVWLCITNSR